MIYILITAILVMIISILVIKISMLISKKMKIDNEKMSPFECGFNQITNSRIPFSLRFFLITIIFLIFDIEIALILPMIFTFYTSNLTVWMMTTIMFMIILLAGIFHEWNQGALNWM